MAKKVHSYSLKGDYYHEKQVVSEYDKKTDTTSYYKLDDILSEFDNKKISIVIKEENDVDSVNDPFNDDEE